MFIAGVLEIQLISVYLFCTIEPCWASLLVLIVFWWFSEYFKFTRSCHVQIEVTVLLPFLLYIFLAWLPLLRPPARCWIEVVRVYILALFLTSGEKFQSSPLIWWYLWGFIHDFIKLKKFLSIPNFVECFYIYLHCLSPSLFYYFHKLHLYTSCLSIHNYNDSFMQLSFKSYIWKSLKQIIIHLYRLVSM